jgi:hypothetical protein
MPCVGFEPKIPASERATIVHALDRAATVTTFWGMLANINFSRKVLLHEIS